MKDIFHLIRYQNKKTQMKKFVIFISILVLMFILNNCSTSLPQNPELYFSKSEYNISIGTSREITINIKNVKNLFACAMELRYDHSVVNYEIGSFYPGSFWTETLYNYSQEDDYGLSVCVGLEQTGGLSGEGDLFSVKLLGLCANETILRIENVSLIDENGNYIKGFDSLKLRESYLIIQ